MTKQAWVENGKIRDIANGDPNENYHPSVSVHFSSAVPDDAMPGDSWDGTTLTHHVPGVPDAQPVTYGKVNPIHFKLCFTAAERVAINAVRATDPILQDVFAILDDVRLQEVDLNLKSVSDTLDYLQVKSLIAPGRKADILAGKLQ